jgi:hypothetical protein
MTTTVITSSVLDQILCDHPEMDHVGYLQHEFRERHEVHDTLFQDLVDRSDNITASLAHLVPKRALVPVMQFLGVEITPSRLAYIRAVDVAGCEPLALGKSTSLGALVLKNNPSMVELTHFAAAVDALEKAPKLHYHMTVEGARSLARIVHGTDLQGSDGGSSVLTAVVAIVHDVSMHLPYFRSAVDRQLKTLTRMVSKTGPCRRTM